MLPCTFANTTLFFGLTTLEKFVVYKNDGERDSGWEMERWIRGPLTNLASQGL